MWSEHERPDPDELLAQAETAEDARTRGKLKVFLGYVAGVGKTYSMLEAAHQRRAEGVDVVVGYIETHGRRETEALLDGLELVARRRVDYRGTALTEMDLDGILKRRPQLVLVDELAHTNAPGARHPKRYDDVEELLAAGIDVYTTLNIQHLESLKDAVAQVTGVTVRETVPDRLLDAAADIELIDLPPAELLQRLAEGKVYVADQAGRALRKFFRQGNLSALRQMALRRAAERVDVQMRDYMQRRAIAGPWPAGERLLVCVSSSPLSERLIRTARRWADRLDAEWYAAYVETPDNARLTETARRQLLRNLQLAEELGAMVVTLPGQSIAETVTTFARRQNVTKIIAGKPVRSRWTELLRTSVTGEIIRQSGPIDVNIISADASQTIAGRAAAGERSTWRQYLLAIALVVLVNLISWPIHGRLEPTNLVMLYLVAVVIAATFLGPRPSALASVLAVVTFDFLWIEPRFSFAVKDTQYILTFLGLFSVGMVISSLSSRAKAQLDAARDRERQAMALFSISRDLTSAVGIDQITGIICSHVGETFAGGVAVLLPDEEANLRLYRRTGDRVLDESELAVAVWAFQHATPAGRGTDTLPAAGARYLPLIAAHGVVGVLGVELPDSIIAPNERRLLEALANLAAVAIERAHLARDAGQVRLLRAKEEFQTTLLNSISHDLRTPLVSIMGVLSTLRAAAVAGAPTVRLDDASRRTLIDTASEQADRLNRLFANLLDMTRLEGNALKLKREPSDLQDAIGAALAQMGDRLVEREVRVDIPVTLPLIPLDFVLIVQVLVNLIDNAVKYSPAGGAIDLTVRPTEAGAVQVQVADRGIGIPPGDLPHVFDKFYRVQRADGAGGTGLGLAICKGIVGAHGGQISAGPRPGGGTIVAFTLPMQAR